jgi:uncharacterized iron-regulated membrane protein
MATTSVAVSAQGSWLNYRTIWRWHFYAGLFCIPFVLWLAVTGSIYLFKPQVEAWLDRPYENMPIRSARSSAAAQIQAALAAVPGANLHYYQLPRTEHSAVQIVVGRKTEEFRVYVDPYTLQPLRVVNEDQRLMRRVFHLHGELLMGDFGSWIVETAASWAVIMILTGLYLWWPRDAMSMAGVIYPRLGRGGRMFWRDLHAVTGVWVSALALTFLLSGLPWAKSWGAYLKLARRLSGESNIRQDWTTGRSSEIAQRMAMNSNASAMVDEHAEHRSHIDMSRAEAGAYVGIDTVLSAVERLHLVFPVLISPPKTAGGSWLAKSDSQDRVLRDQVTVSPATGAILSRVNFNQRPWVDRAVGIGVAMHEGHLYGWANQLVNLGTALGLIVLCLSAIAMWWKRRPEGALGAPTKRLNPRVSVVLGAIVCALALYLPLFGLTLAIALLIERTVLRRMPAARLWLGLDLSPRNAAGESS